MNLSFKESVVYLPAVAAATGVIDTIKYAHSLQIKPGELGRYLAKSFNLLDRERAGTLLLDGLERGVVTTEFVLQTMGIREIFDRKCDIWQLGIYLQIVDDVLDFEDDLKKGDQNCLANAAMRAAYLKKLPHGFNDSTLGRLFPYGGILTYVIRAARGKAENMLEWPERYFTQ